MRGKCTLAEPAPPVDRPMVTSAQESVDVPDREITWTVHGQLDLGPV